MSNNTDDRTFGADPTEDGSEIEHMEIEPETFDFEAYLNGIRPIRAHYTLFGLRLVLQSRSSEWREAWEKKSKKFPVSRQDAGFIHGHIVEPQLTIDQVERLQSTAREQAREGDLAGLHRLLIQLDTQPENRIDERFLLPASD